LAQALGAGDVAAAARCWSTPALVVTESGATGLSNKNDVDAQGKRMIEQFRLRGPGAMHVRIEHIEQLGKSTALAGVGWSTPDGSRRGGSRWGFVRGADNGGWLCLRMRGRRAGNGAAQPGLPGALEGTCPASDPISHAGVTTAGAPDSRRSTK